MLNKRNRKTRLLGALFLLLLLGYKLSNEYIRVTDTWVPRPLWYGEQIQSKKVSPDGKFEAEVVYLDGLTYGIQFVRLRDLRNPIIPFAHKIAISNVEEVTGIEWESANELLIYATPEPSEKSDVNTLFEVKESECYGVKIDYQLKKSEK